jgi:hypothetical protein
MDIGFEKAEYYLAEYFFISFSMPAMSIIQVLVDVAAYSAHDMLI